MSEEAQKTPAVSEEHRHEKKSKRRYWLRRHKNGHSEQTYQQSQPQEQQIPSAQISRATSMEEMAGTSLASFAPDRESVMSCPVTVRFAHSPIMTTASAPATATFQASTAPPAPPFHDPVAAPESAIRTSPRHAPEISQDQLFALLSAKGFFIPANATLSSHSLLLFKRHTPHADIFSALINQLFAELGRVSRDLLEQGPGGFKGEGGDQYAWKEDIMKKLLTEIVPSLSHCAESVAGEVGRAMGEQRGGVRLWVGGHRKKEEEEKEKEKKKKTGGYA